MDILTEALNAGVLTEDSRPATELEELLKEAIRCEAVTDNESLN